MIAALVDSWLVTIYNPATRPLSRVGLEVVVVACAIATLVHAIRAHRRGDPLALFTWITVLVYGTTMEVLSYNFIENFTHSQFTVMFYEKQLPLYVTAIYPAFLYTAIATVRRLGLGRVAEPFAVGLVIVAMDFPFDILGPMANWWTWSNADPNLAFRWHGVPVTSYYWHLAFGGILALLTRTFQLKRPSVPRAVLKAFPVAVLTIILGVLAFAPFHGLKRIGVPDGTIVAAALGISFIILVRARRQQVGRPDWLLMSVPALFYGYHLVVALAMQVPGSRVAVILGFTLFAVAVNLVAHRPLTGVWKAGEPPRAPEASHPQAPL